MVNRKRLTLIPAVDILGGRCVRLKQGAYDQVQEYDEDPVSVARRFREAGATRIHVVDLDGADGRPEVNRPVIERIRREVPITMELGGGIRSEETVKAALDLGVDRLIVGTVLARDPDSVATWVSRYGSRFIAGIDARDGEVKVAGWREGTKLQAETLSAQAALIGVVSIIYTNISQDGMLEGPDIDGTGAIAAAAEVPVILSGGVSSLSDLETIEKRGHPGVVAAIAGKAIYEGRIDPAEAFDRFPGEREEVAW